MTDDSTAPRSDALIMFGLTGDLGEKKLFPALYELAAAGRLGVPVVAVGRTEHSDDELFAMRDASLDGYRTADGSPVDPEIVDSIDLSYLSGDSTEAATYDELVTMIGDAQNPTVYAALPPSLFGDVAQQMSESSLSDSTRLVVEKPFGDSEDSARQLFDAITVGIGADDLFIVDHFLAKSSIENMLAVRSANALIANSVDAGKVARIDIVMDEAGGVDGRGSFYESVGAIKDVVQNHLLQTLAMLTMEPPTNDSDAAFDAARVALLTSVRAIDPNDAVLGQYDGYRDLDDVDDDSEVETFVACRLFIDDERWRGVPITIRTGKRLAADCTTATIELVDPVDADGKPRSGAIRNRIRFEVKPTASVTLELGVLDPDTHDARTAEMVVCGPDDHGGLGDYATMLDNAMSGVSRHFAHIDGVVEAWRIVAPIIDSELSLVSYEPGGDGPPTDL